jgi:hypothetical protein
VLAAKIIATLDSVVGGRICCVWVSCCRCKRVPSRCPPLRAEHLSVGLEPDRAWERGKLDAEGCLTPWKAGEDGLRLVQFP